MNDPLVDDQIMKTLRDTELVEREAKSLFENLTVGDQKRTAACVRTKIEEAKFYLRDLMLQRNK